MAITLLANEYNEIRLAIDRDIDEDDLTDAEIDANTVLGAAESYVMQRIPRGQNGLNTAETRAYRRAVLYRCAWNLVPSFPQQIAETAGQLSARHQAATVEKRQEILQAQVDEDIQKLVDAGHGVVDEADDDFTPAVAVFTVN